MSARITIVVFALLGASLFGLASRFVFSDMLARVNGRLPDEQRFATDGWYWPKTQRLKREYERLYPDDGSLLQRFDALTIATFACLLICVLVAIASR